MLRLDIVGSLRAISRTGTAREPHLIILFLISFVTLTLLSSFLGSLMSSLLYGIFKGLNGGLMPAQKHETTIKP